MTEQTIVFKNNLPNLTVLKIFSQDFSVVKAKLQQKLKQAPMMFIGMQVIIDVSAFDNEDELILDIKELTDFLQGEGVNPIAFMSDRKTFRQELFKKNMGVLPVLHNQAERNTCPEKKSTDISSETVVEPVKKEQVQEEPRKTFESNEETSEVNEKNHVIRHSIRSGQRIYSKGDLTVVGSVSHGAEVIANGSIHVYGKLNGRAIAGANGDEASCIFCQSLNAELVSIAGNYKQLDDICEGYRHKHVQISLEKEKIVFSSL